MKNFFLTLSILSLFIMQITLPLAYAGDGNIVVAKDQKRDESAFWSSTSSTLLILMTGFAAVTEFKFTRTPSRYLMYLASLSYAGMYFMTYFNYEASSSQTMEVTNASKDQQLAPLMAAQSVTAQAEAATRSLSNYTYYYSIALGVMTAVALAEALACSNVFTAAQANAAGWCMEVPSAHIIPQSLNRVALTDFSLNTQLENSSNMIALVEKGHNLNLNETSSLSLSAYNTQRDVFMPLSDPKAENALNKLFAIIIPTADAKLTKGESTWKNVIDIIALLGGGAAAALTATKLSSQIGTMNAWVRPAYYAGMGLLAVGAGKAYETNADELKSNANKYKQLVDILMRENGVAPEMGSSAPVLNTISASQIINQSNVLPELKLCSALGSCDKVVAEANQSVNKLTSLTSLPSDLTSLTSDILSSSKSILGGDLGKGSSLITATNKNAARNSAMIQKRQKEMLDRAVKDKYLKPAEFAALTQKVEAAIRDNGKRVLASLTPAQASALNQIATFKTPQKEKSVQEALKKVETKVAAKAAKEGVANPMDGLFFASDDKSTNTNEAPLPTAAEALSNLEVESGEISDQTDTSIFTMISSRYYKSAFPKFFEEQK